jgi:hypothetical protein
MAPHGEAAKTEGAERRNWSSVSAHGGQHGGDSGVNSVV